MAGFLYSIIILPVQYLIQLIFSAAWLLTYNAGISIIAVSLAVNLLCLPLYKRADAIQEAEKKKQEKMKPWLDHITHHFKGDERFMMRQSYYRQQEYSALSPLKGMISLVLQIPFLIAAYRYLSTLSVLKGASFFIFEDLSKPDGLIRTAGHSINLLPFMMTFFNLLSSVIYSKGQSLREHIQPVFIALVFLVFLYPCPSGLVFYWTLNNLFSLLKNIFMKLVKNPEKVISVAAAVCGAGVCAWALSSGVMFKTVGAGKRVPDAGHIVFITTLILMLFIPLIMQLAKRKTKKEENKRSLPVFKADVFMTVLAGMLSVLVYGGLIPLSIIEASPLEFVDRGAGTMPMDHVINMLCVASGIFLFWGMVFFNIADKKIRGYITVVMVLLPAFMLIDHMIFGKTFGTLSADLLFSGSMNYDASWQIANAAVLLFTAAFMIRLIKKFPQLIRYAYMAFLAAGLVLFIKGALNTEKTLDAAGMHKEESLDTGSLMLSREGKNVVVIMLDRAVGSIIPEIFKREDELAEAYKDFTYYGNTVSFGAHTNFGSPSLFGGYDYTPLKMNERKDTKLSEKHDEALKILPMFFSERDFHISLCDLPYAGYYERPAADVFKDIPDTEYLSLTDGQCVEYLSDEEKTEITASGGGRDYRIFMYSMMRSMPVCIQPFVYSKGKYMSVTNVPVEYIDQYAALYALPYLTGISENEKEGCLIMMNNEMTHEAVTLSLPDYVYSAYPDNSAYQFRYSSVPSWHTAVRALKCIRDWMEYLKEEGVYDNTRLIIASDHGYGLGEYVLEDGTDVQAFMPLFMIKDFDTENEAYITDDSFMTLADVPLAAVNGFSDEVKNPFTGNLLSDDAGQKEEPYITASEKYVITENNGSVFDTGNDHWYTVHGDIHEKENWRDLGADNAAER